MADEKKTGVSPRVYTFEPTIFVELTNRQPDDGPRVRNDDGTISAFLQWKLDNDIYQLGAGSTGPGFYSGVYLAKHAPAIEAWLRDRGLVFDLED